MPDVTQGLCINVAYDRCKLRVIHAPEPDQLGPRPVLIPLDTNPFISIVSWYFDTGIELESHEPLVVVGSGVDEVAENFLPGPLVRRRTKRCLPVWNLKHPVGNAQ